MSLSREERLKNIDLALTLMLRELGDRAFTNALFRIGLRPFEDVHPTTWQELVRRGLITKSDTILGSFCELTGDGWRAALELAWLKHGEILQQTLSKVAAALKDQVKGRHEDAVVSLDNIVTASGVPENLVFNIIESRLLDHWCNMKGACWYQGRPPLVHIPLEFGLEPL